MDTPNTFNHNNGGLCNGPAGRPETLCSPEMIQDTDGDVSKGDDAAIKEEDEGDVRTKEDEEVQRVTWSNKRDYILSLMGCSIGVGNIWRFPYICIRNGGGE